MRSILNRNCQSKETEIGGTLSSFKLGQCLHLKYSFWELHYFQHSLLTSELWYIKFDQ